jgi:hypothetical protein
LNSSCVIAVERRLRCRAARFTSVSWRIEPQAQVVRVDWSERDAFGGIREHATRMHLRWNHGAGREGERFHAEAAYEFTVAPSGWRPRRAVKVRWRSLLR